MLISGTIYLLIIIAAVENIKVKIKIQPSSYVTKRLGRHLNLTCSVKSSLKDYSISWTGPGVYHGATHRSLNSSYFIIDEVSLLDSGEYRCIVAFNKLKKGVSHRTKSVNVDIIQDSKLECSTKFYMCHSGHCIPKRYVCDGYDDCPDGSDEYKSKCGAEVCGNRIKCSDGRCIPASTCCFPIDPTCKVSYILPCCRKYRNNLITNQKNSTSSNKPQIMSNKKVGRMMYLVIYGAVGIIVIVVSISLLQVLSKFRKMANSCNSVMNATIHLSDHRSRCRFDQNGNNEEEVPNLLNSHNATTGPPYSCEILTTATIHYNHLSDHLLFQHINDSALNRDPNEEDEVPSYAEACFDAPPTYDSIEAQFVPIK